LISIGDYDDTDGDGAPDDCGLICSLTGLEADSDDDGDGVLDEDDYAPLDPLVQYAPVVVGGGGVKGPLVDGLVTLYKIDGSAADLKGDVVDTGSTDEEAKIQGLEIPFPAEPPYILEISAIEGTTDLTTGKYPVITVLSTILTEELLETGEGLYATPLTTMAVEMVVTSADSVESPYAGNGDGFVDGTELAAALVAAENRVKSTMGFGVGDDVSIYDTPPLIDASTTSEEDQLAAASYRSAVEGMTAVVYQMQQASGDDSASTDDVLASLAADLSDGEIDGNAGEGETVAYAVESLELFDQDPSTLPIPGDDSGRTVGDVKALVVAETAATGSETDTAAFAASETVVELKPATTDPDKDDDGVDNAADAFPEDAGADTDTDGDGKPDIAYFVTDGVRSTSVDEARSDDDDDNDGVKDVNDAFPTDETEYLDTDGDGVGNNADTDDDGDGALDAADAFPLDASETTDTDGDGIGNNTDTDDDADGVKDTRDAFPLDPAEYLDTDGDGVGNNADTDDDGDGVADVSDPFPLDGAETLDTDGDGIGNNTDTDDDADGVKDTRDAFPLDPAEYLDTDGDGVGNNADTDDDGDGVAD
ncbi:MAG: thrombospondin type 3 repeat-containing protein, partial [Pseudomonadales bacterium]